MGVLRVNKNKTFRGFCKKKFRGFSKFLKFEFELRQIFENLIFDKPSLGSHSREILQKFGPDRFSCFDVYWIQTNKQTNRKTDRQTSQRN